MVVRLARTSRVVTFSLVRRLPVLLVLACVAAQPATRGALLATALTIATHGSHHAHSVSVVADEGHFDLVFSHHESGGHDHGDAPHGEDGTTSLDEGDHVLHLSGDDAAGAGSRRAGLDPAPPLAMAIAIRFAVVPVSHLRAPPQARARSSDHLKTVVLRL